MRANTIVMLVLAVIFGVGAVILTNMYLTGQQASLVAVQQPSSPEKNTSIVVAAAPLRFGDRLTVDNTREVPWSVDAFPKGAFRTKADLLSGNGDRQVLSPMEPNEPVLSWKVTGPGQRASLSAVLEDGMKAVSIRINDVVGVAGFVLPGDRVDVMLTRNSNGQPYVDVLLQNIKVLAIDQLADESKNAPKVAKVATLQVTTEDAQKLTLAANVGTLSLALREIASNASDAPKRVTVNDLTNASIEAAQQEAMRRAAAEQQAREDELKSLQEQLKNQMNTNDAALQDRINQLEAELAKAQTTPAPPVTVAEPPPSNMNVEIGVVRGLKQQNYQVPAAK